MAKRALTGDDITQLRGNGGFAEPQAANGSAKNHRLQSGSHPRRTPQSRAVKVTKNGRTFWLTSTLRDIAKEQRLTAMDRRLLEMEHAEIFASKRQQLATGAQDVETWSSHDKADTTNTTPTAYYFRGEYYSTLDSYLEAIEAVEEAL